MAQVISLLVFVAAAALFVIRRQVLHQKPAPVPVPAEAAPVEGPKSPVRRKGRVLDPQKSKSRS
jgi:hypothetical protein